MRPVATLGFPDSISFGPPCCVYAPNIVTPVVSRILTNGRPTAKLGDVLTPVPGAPTCNSGCPPLFRKIIAVSTVFKEGRCTAHVGDLTAPATPRIILPSPTTVFAN
jgi:hypothetical protein